MNFSSPSEIEEGKAIQQNGINRRTYVMAEKAFINYSKKFSDHEGHNNIRYEEMHSMKRIIFQILLLFLLHSMRVKHDDFS